MSNKPDVSSPVNALHIPYVNAAEAYDLLQVALQRLLTVLGTLSAEEWKKPTACTAWNVRDMVAHQAGGYASGTGYMEMLRQYAVIPRRGELIEDAINRRQVGERSSKSPDELLAELRRTGPIAAQKWAYQFRLLKPIAIPHPVGGLLSVRHLMWIIHSRDTWMHRLDICRATNRPFEQTPEHDGRIASLVMRDVARQLQPRLGGKALLFCLSGVAGGLWKVGTGEAAATVQMDVLDFNIFASGRYSYEEAQSRWTLSGDRTVAEVALKRLLVLY